IGFKSITTIEKVCEAFPELDMVNHMNRVRLSEMISTQGLAHDENFRPIDGNYLFCSSYQCFHFCLFFKAIVLLGEPIQCQRNRQSLAIKINMY
ncbi:unnamed protein product, partial [Rotaria sp. Silwood2]